MDMDPQSLQLLTSILIFTISGVLSDGLQVTLDPEVTYSRQSICGLKRWSLAVSCSFSPPTNQTISSVFWFTSKQRHQWRSEDQPEDLLLDADYMGRVTYSGTEHSSELTITDLRLGDSGVYHCLYVSNEGRYSDSTGVNVTVTDLQIKAVGQNSVAVSCKTLCTLELKTLKVPDEVKYFYFNIQKNGQYRNHFFLNDPAIQLNKGDGGSYTCTVGGLDHLPSPAVCVLSDRCWGVTYSETRSCALVGSSVEMSSSYTYPKGLTVRSAFWKHEERNLCSRNIVQKFKCGGEKGDASDKSSLAISDVKETDAGEYQFRFVVESGFSGKPGVFLSVTDLQVRMSADNVSEGQNVTLTCSTSCSLSYNSTFVWYKNGHPVAHRHIRKRNKLYLITLNTKDGGDYSCAVEGHNHLPSPAVTLYIRASGLAHYTAGGDHTAVYVTAGIIALLMVLLLCGALWIRKKRRSKSPERTDSTAGGDKVMAPPVSSRKSPQAVAMVDDHNEVQYSSLQFGHKQKNKHLQHQGEDSDVVYASVKPHQHHRSSQAGDAADDVQYSSLEFGQRNKQNNKHQQHEREDADVLYASVRVS